MKKEADILFLILPPWGSSMPHLGIAYLAAYLKKKGYNAQVLDLNIKFYHAVDDSSRRLWQEMDNFKFWTEEKFLLDFKRKFYSIFEFYLNRILDISAEVIGFSVNAANQLLTILFLHELKNRGWKGKVIFGGPSCSQDLDNAIFKNTADIFVVGEGEESLREVLDMIYSRKREDNIKGVIFAENFKGFTKREFAYDLSYLGHPNFEEFDLGEYTEQKLPLLLGRGCVCRCSFCNDFYMQGKFRARRPEEIVAEIMFHRDRNKVKEFFFSDLLINADIVQLEAVCDLIIKNKLNILWEGQALIRKEMGRALLRKLKRAGCFAIAYGVESFSDKVLRKMKKPFSSYEIDKVLRDTHEAGIFTKIGLIIGFPGESDEDFRLTLRGVERNRDCIDNISNIAPCLINEHTDLKDNAGYYGICFTNSTDRYLDWYDKKDNNYQQRKKRVKEALTFFSDININESLVNIYDEAFEKKKNDILVF